MGQSPMTPSRLNRADPRLDLLGRAAAGPKPPAVSGATAAAVPTAKPDSQAVRETDSSARPAAPRKIPGRRATAWPPA